VKGIVKDNEIFQTLEPSVLGAHLGTNGWQKVALVYENTWIRHKKDDAGELFEIKQPLRQEFDPLQLMGEAFKTLEVVENRFQLDILSDLTLHYLMLQSKDGLIKCTGKNRRSAKLH
jgi:hypothetical protein